MVDLCSPIPTPQSPLNSSQQDIAGRPEDSVSRACAKAMAAAVSLASRLGPASEGGMHSDARLTALRGLLCVVGSSAPSMLADLAPTVGEWAASCLLPVNSGNYRLQDVALTLGVCIWRLLCLALGPPESSSST